MVSVIGFITGSNTVPTLRTEKRTCSGSAGYQTLSFAISGSYSVNRSSPSEPVRVHLSQSRWWQQFTEAFADAPARLKRELDAILVLQSEIENINRTIQTTKTSFSKTIPDTTTVIKELESAHNDLVVKVEQLYTSLNIQDSFDDLDGIDFNFVHTLLLARDLKINIRKRAIGTFFEWDKLDRAVGGRNQPLGSCRHFLLMLMLI